MLAPSSHPEQDCREAQQEELAVMEEGEGRVGAQEVHGAVEVVGEGLIPNVDGEFDPGSERTLAAWIRHASRAIPARG